MKSRRGIALMVVLQMLMLVFVICIGFLVHSNNNLFFVGQEKRGTAAFYVAEGAMQMAMQNLHTRTRSLMVYGNYGQIDAVDTTGKSAVTGTMRSSDGEAIGTYAITYEVTPKPGQPQVPATPWPASAGPEPSDSKDFEEYKQVKIQVTATVGSLQRTLDATVLAGLKRSGLLKYDPFKYAYFMNNWGWFSGFGPDQMQMYGNTGANGNYDLLSGYLGVHGNPERAPRGRKPLRPAVYAARKIRTWGSATFTGYGASTSNQESDATPREMPNLSNLDYYRDLANGKKRDANGDLIPKGSIKINGRTIVDGTFGGTGAQQSLVLDGTTNAIEISGPVLVEGNVVIKGKVQGQGTLVVGRNLYVAGNLDYVNGPTERPTYQTSESPEEYEARIEAWKTENAGADAVGYLVRKNVVFGDVTNKSSWWDRKVGKWINASYDEAKNKWALNAPEGSPQRVNDNHEDAGFDATWTSKDNTEDDGKWTVQVVNVNSGELSTQTFEVQNGQANIPANYKVVPGTGEDIDGDGKYTGAYDYQRDFNLADANGNSIAFTSEFFGEAPGGSFSDFVNRAGRVDGFLYTNAAAVGDQGDGSTFVLRGGVVARQDAMVVSARTSEMFHDERFSDMNRGERFGLHLPPFPGISVVWSDANLPLMNRGYKE